MWIRVWKKAFVPGAAGANLGSHGKDDGSEDTDGSSGEDVAGLVFAFFGVLMCFFVFLFVVRILFLWPDETTGRVWEVTKSGSGLGMPVGCGDGGSVS